MKEKGNSVFLSPAMNTDMWNHPITIEHVNKLKIYGYNIIMPIEKKLACGDTGKYKHKQRLLHFTKFLGMGAMAHIDYIVEQVLSLLDK